MLKAKKLKIKNGILVFDEDLILVNPEEAHECEYACIIECRNGHKYGNDHFGVPVPHFLYLCNVKYGCDYDDALIASMHKACTEKWPYFKDVLKHQIAPIYDPDNCGYMLNSFEWNQAPTIGYFAVYEVLDPLFNYNYIPYFPAKIIR
ncbi:hypothetical protein SAMN06296386_11519 [Lachnospiraceae bacterium]|nr:hypothetical protein SAMN06296386_11519 [Lachnospiraceae bacterium]